MQKLNIGWFSFACCEDSTIMFAEWLNDYFFEFKSHFNLVDANVLQSGNDKESPLDIAFVEGASNSPEHEKEMKVIRERAKIVVAIGSCACTGMPSAHRNNFDHDQLKEIDHILQKFAYSDTVKKLEDVISVDAKVPGCPMDLDDFTVAVNKLLEQHSHQPLRGNSQITNPKSQTNPNTPTNNKQATNQTSS